MTHRFPHDEWQNREDRKRRYPSNGLAHDLDALRNVRREIAGLQVEEMARLEHIFDHVEHAGVASGETTIVNSAISAEIAYMVDRLDDPYVNVTSMKVST